MLAIQTGVLCAGATGQSLNMAFPRTLDHTEPGIERAMSQVTPYTCGLMYISVHCSIAYHVKGYGKQIDVYLTN